MAHPTPTTTNVVRRRTAMPKMDFARALSTLGFTTSRTLDPSGGHDPKAELNLALSRKMAIIERKKYIAIKNENKLLSDRLRDEIRTLHEAYQFLAKKYARLLELQAANQEANSKNLFDMLDDGEVEVYGGDDDQAVSSNVPPPDLKTKPTSAKKKPRRAQSATLTGRKLTKSELAPQAIMPVVMEEETNSGEKRKKSSSGERHQQEKTKNRKRSEGKSVAEDSSQTSTTPQPESECVKINEPTGEDGDEEVRRPEAHDNLDDIINRMFNIIAKITSEEIPEEEEDTFKPELKRRSLSNISI